MSLPPRTAIIGLGLMGGSIARELTGRGGVVLASDANPDVVGSARAGGFVHEPLDSDLRGVAAADLVVIATPVDTALHVLTAIAPHLAPHTVVTDVGSTKREIVERAVQLGIAPAFVGSHPLAGDHRSGWHASRAGLYADTHVFLCPTPSTEPGALERVDAFWEALGARREIIDPADHDRRMAWVSHLPQIASSTVAAALAASGCKPADLGPGGRDVTRLAASSPEMWSAICLTNAENLTTTLDALQERLARVRAALEKSDGPGLLAFFQEARDWLE